MRKIAYHNIQDIDLPSIVISSLIDTSEVANIRTINNIIYIIVTYPISQNEVVPICLRVDNDDLSLYYRDNIDMKLITNKTSFTDFITVVLDQYGIMCEKVNAVLEGFENVMDEGVKKSDIQLFFALSKGLIYYETAINSIGEVLAYVMSEKPDLLWSHTSASEFTNIRIEINQLNQNIDMYQKVIASIISVSDSLFSNKLNVTMKTLTSVTLVLSIPTFITSFYGMNINLPFQDHPNSLFIVFTISLILTGLSVIYLYRKDFF